MSDFDNVAPDYSVGQSFAPDPAVATTSNQAYPQCAAPAVGDPSQANAARYVVPVNDSVPVTAESNSKREGDGVETIKKVTEGVDTAKEDYEKAGKVVEKGGELLGREAKLPELPEGVGVATGVVKTALDVNDAVKSARTGDYSSAGQSTIDAAGDAAGATEGVANMLVASGLPAEGLAAAASDAAPPLAVASASFKAGTHLAKDVADNKDYAKDEDGNCRFGERAPQDGGGCRTRMDDVVDAGKAGEAAGGGGVTGKALGVMSAAGAGIVNGLSAIPDAIGTNPADVVRRQEEGVRGTERMIQSQIDRDHASQLLPAPTPEQLSAAVTRIQLANAPDLPTGKSYLPGADPNQHQYSGDDAVDDFNKKFAQ
jgi:hypothetical protein